MQFWQIMERGHPCEMDALKFIQRSHYGRQGCCSPPVFLAFSWFQIDDLSSGFLADLIDLAFSDMSDINFYVRAADTNHSESLGFFSPFSIFRRSRTNILVAIDTSLVINSYINNKQIYP